MGFVRPGIAGLVCMALVALAASAHSRFDPSNDRSDASTEALFGSYHCGLGLEGGFTWMGAEGTGDVTPEDLFLTRSIEGFDGSPAETCDALSGGALELMQARRCVTGPIEARDDDDGGASRDFHYVCRSGRNALVKTLAELGSYVLTAMP